MKDAQNWILGILILSAIGLIATIGAELRYGGATAQAGTAIFTALGALAAVWAVKNQSKQPPSKPPPRD